MNQDHRELVAAPEVYFDRKPKGQKVTSRRRPENRNGAGNWRFRKGRYRVTDVVYDALHAIRTVHLQFARQHKMPKLEAADWTGEILENYADKHLREYYGLTFEEFAARRRAGASLEQLAAEHESRRRATAADLAIERAIEARQ